MICFIKKPDRLKNYFSGFLLYKFTAVTKNHGIWWEAWETIALITTCVYLCCSYYPSDGPRNVGRNEDGQLCGHKEHKDYDRQTDYEHVSVSLYI